MDDEEKESQIQSIVSGDCQRRVEVVMEMDNNRFSVVFPQKSGVRAQSRSQEITCQIQGWISEKLTGRGFHCTREGWPSCLCEATADPTQHVNYVQTDSMPV